MADSIVGSFSDSDVKQRSVTFCVMDVQTILFNAYKTQRSLSSRRPTHCDGLHLAMDPAHRALRARHSQRHVLGKPLFPAMSFTVVPLHAEMMFHVGMMQPAAMNILLCLSIQSPAKQRPLQAVNAPRVLDDLFRSVIKQLMQPAQSNATSYKSMYETNKHVWNLSERWLLT